MIIPKNFTAVYGIVLTLCILATVYLAFIPPGQNGDAVSQAVHGVLNDVYCGAFDAVVSVPSFLCDAYETTAGTVRLFLAAPVPVQWVVGIVSLLALGGIAALLALTRRLWLFPIKLVLKLALVYPFRGVKQVAKSTVGRIFPYKAASGTADNAQVLGALHRVESAISDHFNRIHDLETYSARDHRAWRDLDRRIDALARLTTARTKDMHKQDSVITSLQNQIDAIDTRRFNTDRECGNLVAKLEAKLEKLEKAMGLMRNPTQPPDDEAYLGQVIEKRFGTGQVEQYVVTETGLRKLAGEPAVPYKRTDDGEAIMPLPRGGRINVGGPVFMSLESKTESCAGQDPKRPAPGGPTFIPLSGNGND